MTDKPEVPYGLLVPLALVGFTDAISYMVTAPSIVFYVIANSGSYEAYGIILSSFSFSAFIFKPILGYWCDRYGCFRQPYLASLAVAALGGMVYFSASKMQNPHIAIAFILIGRLLGGVGQANSTLGFTYIAKVVDKAALTQASSLLSMVRILGMVIAPGLNVFLKGINTSITVGSIVISLTPLNSVGLFLGLGNLLAALIIYFFFEEPAKEDPQAEDDGKDEASTGTVHKKEAWWSAFVTIELIVPILSSFALTVNANFQLLETGLVPVASDALGWGPLSISYVFAGNAILILFAIICTIYLSGKGVLNETLLTVGLILSATGYTLMKPNTFNFHNGGRLETKSLAPSGYHTMQALMSMVVSVAGFTTPGIISAFVLRKPEEVDASSDNREFAPWALFAPVLSLIVLVGLLYMHWIKKPLETTAKEEVDETSSLMGTTPLKWSRKDYSVPSFDPKTIAARRECLTLMCIPQITYEDFQEEENHGRRTSTGSIPVVHADGYQQTRKSYFF